MVRFDRLLIMLIMVAPLSLAQQSQAGLKDQAGLQWLQASLIAVGGHGVQPGFQSVALTGTVSILSGQKTSSHAFALKATQKEYRIEGDGSPNTRTYTSGHGHPAEHRNGKTTKLPYHVSRTTQPFLVPALVLSNVLNEPNWSLVLKGIEGTVRPLVHLQLKDEADDVEKQLTLQDWYIDATTGLPARVTYRTFSAQDPARYSDVTLVYSNYQRSSGVQLPSEATATVRSITQHYKIRSVSLDSGVSEGDFDLDGGAQ